MAKTLGRWFRFYDGALDDPKAQQLTDPLFRVWVNFLCLANRTSGIVPHNVKAIAFSLRLSEGRTRESLQALSAARLIDISETAIVPHNWSMRQYKSDVSTERVKRFRHRYRNGDETFHETASDTEQSRAEPEQRFCSTSRVNSPIKPLVQNQDSAREEIQNHVSPSSASGLEGQSSEGSVEVKSVVHPLLKTLRLRNGHAE